MFKADIFIIGHATAIGSDVKCYQSVGAVAVRLNFYLLCFFFLILFYSLFDIDYFFEDVFRPSKI